MVSVERILDYQVLEVEAPEETSSEVVKLPSDWPSEGKIEFDRLSLEYLPGEPVLKAVSFQVTGGSKVGVVGRTGAGKSSLVAALFRLTEPSGGQIRLDGIETTKVGLSDLRKRISIIPQDPVIFSGSVRYNLDPFDEFTDDQLWAALEEVQLKKTVTGYKACLEEALSDGGGNMSCGERQLLCLARALLRQNKVLVLDEATAAVDHETDALIQRTIRRSQFANCTLITIAHRLNTIIDCDRVLVLDGGEVLEYDAPLKLLDQKGAFYQMCKKTGPSMYAHLYAAAKEASSGKQ